MNSGVSISQQGSLNTWSLEIECGVAGSYSPVCPERRHCILLLERALWLLTGCYEVNGHQK